MKKTLKRFECLNYFQKTLYYEKAFIKKGLEENKCLKNDTIRTKKCNKDEKLVLLEYERKKILQKNNFFKNNEKVVNFVINNVSSKNMTHNLNKIKFYNIRKRKQKEKAFKLLESKL